MDDETIFGSFPRTRTSRKAISTQLAIMDCLLLLLENRPIEKITVTDIVREAGITRSTFYVYFEDVYDVLSYIEANLTEHLPKPEAGALKTLSPSPSQPPTAEQCEIPNWYTEWFNYIEQFHRQFKALLGPHGNPQFPHKLRRAIRKAHRQQMDIEGFIGGDDQELLLNALSEFQLRFAKEIVSSPSEEKRAFAKKTGLLFINTFRIGGLYLRHINNDSENTPS